MTAVPVRPGSDPRDSVLQALSAGLRGPRRTRSDLLAELRDGLDDATDDLIASGLGVDEARHRAVAEFGDPRSLARELQAELTGVQARRTALGVALGSLLIEAAWDWGYPTLMIEYTLSGHQPTGSPVLEWLDEGQAMAVWIVCPLLLVTYALIFRRTAAVRRTALLIGVLAGGLLTVNLLASGLMTALNPGLIEALRDSSIGLVLQFGSLAALLLLVLSTIRTLRLLVFASRQVPRRE